MSGARLRPYYPSKFDHWVQLTGFLTESEFWQAMTGKSNLTIPDMVDEYLGTLGYQGTIDDKLRSFLSDQTGAVGTSFDNANKFFEIAYSPVTGNYYLLKEDGSFILLEGGDKLQLEK